MGEGAKNPDVFEVKTGSNGGGLLGPTVGLSIKSPAELVDRIILKDWTKKIKTYFVCC